ncbi:hypothetical protein [Synechococcus sp. NB0720_010]|uniref:hypothetical protein n=1 Tax=Synechococcus sp. NB0720_010 TaxID=2907159 RepID=UPI001FF71BDB|nr:hypothetical protein [Synechococcus sp. NB0720_010]UPH89342.1 hypothetical protein LY254_08560 [Synechococcus sp. NB0720_010]
MSSASSDRYAAIERAYGEGRFSDALQGAEALLHELQASASGPESETALSRLQLLTGHIHLYGLGQPQDAQAYYQAVADSTAPSTLVDLAQAGLQRCQLQPAAQEEPSSQQAIGDLPELPATPWLNQLSEPQEALTALQAAWTEVPASGPPPVIATPTVIDGSPATPWGDAAPNVEVLADEPELEPQPTDDAAPAEREWPDYSQGNLVVELPFSENRPQEPLHEGSNWRRFFRLKRP